MANNERDFTSKQPDKARDTMKEKLDKSGKPIREKGLNQEFKAEEGLKPGKMDVAGMNRDRERKPDMGQQGGQMRGQQPPQQPQQPGQNRGQQGGDIRHPGR